MSLIGFPGLYPGGCGGSLVGKLVGMPGVFAAFLPGIGETDSGTSVQEVDFLDYQSGDATKGLIQKVTQATPANQPQVSYLSTGARAMRFVGSAPSYMTGTLSTALPQPFSLSAVVNLDAAASQYVVGRVSSSGVLVYATSGGWGMNAGTGLASATPYSSGSNYLVTWIFNGASSKIYTNRVLQVTGDAGTNSLVDMVLGATGAGGTPMSGLLGPVVGYAGDPDADGTRTTIENLASALAGGIV